MYVLRAANHFYSRSSMYVSARLFPVLLELQFDSPSSVRSVVGPSCLLCRCCQFGRWQQWSRQVIPNASTTLKDHVEFNARNQITLWGPNGEINDYARKEWGGP